MIIQKSKQLKWAAALLILAGCYNNTGPAGDKQMTPRHAKLKQFEWLIGDWVNSTANGQLYETWNKTSDSVFSGKSFMIVMGDTVFSEKISLESRGGDLFYIPIVSNQNEGQAITFKLIGDSGGVFVFENLEHDFPQKVVYSNPAPDSLNAWIEGMDSGKFRKEEFPMKRISKN